MCYLNRTYHVLPTNLAKSVDTTLCRYYYAAVVRHDLRAIHSRAVPPHRICLRQAPYNLLAVWRTP